MTEQELAQLLESVLPKRNPELLSICRLVNGVLIKAFKNLKENNKDFLSAVVFFFGHPDFSRLAELLDLAQYDMEWVRELAKRVLAEEDRPTPKHIFALIEASELTMADIAA